MDFAFIFPGQGSQSLKMLDGLVDYKVAIDIFTQASDIIGVDLLSMLKDETTERINQTQNTQPLMLASGVASYKIWRELGGKEPSIMAGHSLGEYSALVCSGCLDFADAVKLVHTRARLMQSAVAQGDGAMAAVLGLNDELVISSCKEVQLLGLGVIEAVNFNSPGQVVVAGNKLAVEKAVDILKTNGARKVQLLPVSVPSHCSLMIEASKELKYALDKVDFNIPYCKVLHNCDTNSYNNVDSIKQSLVKQLYMPVLWTDTIHKIVATGVNHIVECGSGKVLSGLNKRIDSSIVSYNLNTIDDVTNTLNNI